MGPAFGPIMGGFVVQYSTWPWMFYATSALSAAIQLAGLLWLPETYGPTILKQRAKKLRKATLNQEIYTNYDENTHWTVLRHAMVRPFRLLGTQPIVQILALFIAYVFGLMYLALSTFSAIWVDIYNERSTVASLNYLSLALGFCLATQICAPTNDIVCSAPIAHVLANENQVYSRLKRRNGNVGRPEFRIPLLVPGVLLIPIGLLWYGWSVESRLHWMMPNFGAFLFGSGVVISMQCTTSYIVDTYSIYAASAVAATTVLRAIMAFGKGIRHLIPY